MKKEKARMYDFKNPNPNPDFVESLYWFMYGLDREGLNFDEGEVQEELEHVRAFVCAARAAYAYDYCNDDDIKRKSRLLLEMRNALRDVKHLLGVDK